MAFNREYLAVVGGSSKAGRLWRYKTEDTLATCDTANYFAGDNGLADVRQFSLGDGIEVTVVTNLGESNEAFADQGLLTVNALDKDAGTIDTANETARTATDTD